LIKQSPDEASVVRSMQAGLLSTGDVRSFVSAAVACCPAAIIALTIQ
jgi:hypothetical protein